VQTDIYIALSGKYTLKSGIFEKSDSEVFPTVRDNVVGSAAGYSGSSSEGAV
jgi:hypothetical protein